LSFIVRGLENLGKVHVLDNYLIGHKGFIAGGCFKNLFNCEKVKDIDVFFQNEIEFQKAKAYFNENQEYFYDYDNNKVFAFKNKDTNITVELIFSVFGSPEEIIEGFDFTITKMAYYNELVADEEGEGDHVENKIIHHSDYFEHLFFKRLVIDNRLPFPVSTFERALRYKAYGYSLCRESKGKLVDGIRTNTNPEDDIFKSLYDGLD
jgi:hypothetical protein